MTAPMPDALRVRIEAAVRAVPCLLCGEIYDAECHRGRDEYTVDCLFEPDYAGGAQAVVRIVRQDYTQKVCQICAVTEMVCPVCSNLEEERDTANEHVDNLIGWLKDARAERDALRVALVFIKGNYQPACAFCVEHRDKAASALTPEGSAHE